METQRRRRVVAGCRRSYFVQGGYTGTITKSTRATRSRAARRSPAGHAAGVRHGSTCRRSPAGRVRFRFRVGTDRSSGSLGWYIDDVRIYRCVTDAAAADGRHRARRRRRSDDRRHGRRRDRRRTATGSSVVAAADLQQQHDLRRRPQDALEMPSGRPSPTGRWSSTAWGGSGGHGTRRVYVQVRDRAGNWSRVLQRHHHLRVARAARSQVRAQAVRCGLWMLRARPLGWRPGIGAPMWPSKCVWTGVGCARVACWSA